MASRKPPNEPPQGLFDFGASARAARTDAPLPEAMSRDSAPEPRVFSVGELVRSASRTLEARFPSIWVEGELSSLSRPRSGHIYFSLTEPDACLPSVMFRSAAVRLKFEPAEGQRVRVRGRLSIFDAQGKFQLYAEAMEPAGIGAQQLAFEALKARLAAEGLFDPAKKRPVPTWPRRIGICTSPTGSVIRDILRVAQRRGRVRTLLAPCQVQGPTAAAEVRAALLALQRVPDIDVIIVARGGGSAEDLACFNDEALARAIRACRVPVVSAIGHEVDFSIADFVADLRAPTPSAAAELVVPLFEHLATRLEDAQRRLHRAGTRTLADGRLALDDATARGASSLVQRITRHRRALEEQRRRLAALHPLARLHADRGRLDTLRARLERAVRLRIAERGRLDALRVRLDRATHVRLVERRRAWESLAGTLSALSPLRVLERGYAIARSAEGHVITATDVVKVGDKVEVLVSRGVLDCRVESTRAEDHAARSERRDEKQ